jgi:hypothetical protein
VLLATLALAGLALGCGTSEAAPAPPQPIAYSHHPHVVENEMPCARCHYGAAEGVKAGLPPASFCVGCHRRRIPDHPEIVKLMKLYESGEPIVWRKVNVMPTSAMVHFEHGPHSRAKVECETCHGDVGNMTLAHEVIETASMAWCVDCHEKQQASIDCVTCHH